MHVLHAAVGEIAAGIDVEQRRHGRIPPRGNVVGLDSALDQVALDAVTQDHMQGIGEFVRVDANETGLHAGEPAMQVVRREGRLVAEVRHHARREQADERAAQADLHFKAEALAFVNAGAPRPGHRLSQPVARQVLFIAPMAGLVDDAPQASHKTILAIARGEAGIFRYAAAKRMRAFVQTAGAEIKTQQRHHLEANGVLRRPRKWTDRRHHCFAGLFLAHLSYQIGQPLLQVAEQRVEYLTGHAGFVVVHQRVVGLQAGVIGQALRLFARELQYVAEIFQEARPMVGRALRAPGVFATRPGERLGLHQRLGQRIGGSPIAANFAQVCALEIVQRLALRTVEIRRQLRVGANAVQQAVHFGHRVCTGGIAVGRHQCRAIP